VPHHPPVKKLHLPLNLCWRRGLNRVAHKGAVVIISPIVAESPMKLQFFNFILRAALYNVQNSCRIIYGQNTEKILFLFIKRWRIIILTPLRFDRARKTLITKKRRDDISHLWHDTHVADLSDNVRFCASFCSTVIDAIWYVKTLP